MAKQSAMPFFRKVAVRSGIGPGSSMFRATSLVTRKIFQSSATVPLVAACGGGGAAGSFALGAPGSFGS